MSFRFIFTRFFPAMLVFMSILSFFPFMQIEDPAILWFARVAGLLVVLCFVFLKIFFYRCKVCKKWFAVKKASVSQAGQDVIEGDIRTGSVTQVANVNSVNYRCKYCGATKSKLKREKYRKI